MHCCSPGPPGAREKGCLAQPHSSGRKGEGHALLKALFIHTPLWPGKKGWSLSTLGLPTQSPSLTHLPTQLSPPEPLPGLELKGVGHGGSQWAVLTLACHLANPFLVVQMGQSNGPQCFLLTALCSQPERLSPSSLGVPRFPEKKAGWLGEQG